LATSGLERKRQARGWRTTAKRSGAVARLPLKVGLDVSRPSELFEERLGEDLVERDVELLAPRDGDPLLEAYAGVRRSAPHRGGHRGRSITHRI
jgi:hypothetical protein